MSIVNPGETATGTREGLVKNNEQVPVPQALQELSAASQIHESVSPVAVGAPEAAANELFELRFTVDSIRKANQFLTQENEGLIRRLKRRTEISYWQLVLTALTFMALLAWHVEVTSGW